MDLLNYLFMFVIATSKQFNIDESHSLKHSMDVFYFSSKIYESELIKNPHLKDQKTIIDVASIMHDMCDKKYMNEEEGLLRIKNYVKGRITESELDASLNIISTMSYSTVKKYYFPDLKEYQLAYHIVREADLLASYDVDRCIIYQMMKNNNNYENAYSDAKILFEKRVFNYNKDNLFLTDYSKELSLTLHSDATNRIKFLNKMFKII